MLHSVVLPSDDDLKHLHISDEELHRQKCFIDCIQVVTEQGDGCWPLFHEYWRYVYNLNINEEFRLACQNPPRKIPAGVKIYVPQGMLYKPVQCYTSNAVPLSVRIPNCPILFRDRQLYTGPKSVTTFEDDLTCFRHQMAISARYRYATTQPGNLMYGLCQFIEGIDWSRNFILKTRTELIDPEVCYDCNWDALLQSIFAGKGCYWIALEPSRLLFDIDFYHADFVHAMGRREITIEQVVEEISKLCDHWLVTETVLEDGRPLHYAADPRLRYRDPSYNIFTDRLVYVDEAMAIEDELGQKFINQYNEDDIYGRMIGMIYKCCHPFTYRRAPFSTQKWWPHENNPLRKKSEPRLHLSNLPMENPCPLDILKFSYPNQ